MVLLDDDPEEELAEELDAEEFVDEPESEDPVEELVVLDEDEEDRLSVR